MLGWRLKVNSQEYRESKKQLEVELLALKTRLNQLEQIEALAKRLVVIGEFDMMDRVEAYPRPLDQQSKFAEVLEQLKALL